MKSITETLLFLQVLCLAYTLNLPSNLQRCKLTDPKLNDCLTSAIQNALPILEKGIPEFNFPPAQPIHVPSIRIGEGKGVVHVVQKFNDVDVYDIIKGKVDKVTSVRTENGFTLSINSTVPTLTFSANYDFDGRILILPIVGKGKSTVIFTDAQADFFITAEEYKKKDIPYYEIKEVKLWLTPKKIHFNFENLFNGDERLSKEMHTVLNDNWKEIWEDVRVGYEETLAAVFKHLTNLIFKRVPINKLF